MCARITKTADAETGCTVSAGGAGGGGALGGGEAGAYQPAGRRARVVRELDHGEEGAGVLGGPGQAAGQAWGSGGGLTNYTSLHFM